MMEAKIEPVVLARLEEIAEQHRDVTPDEKEKLCGQFSLDAPEIGAKLREIFAKQGLDAKLDALEAETGKAETLTALPAQKEEVSWKRRNWGEEEARPAAPSEDLKKVLDKALEKKKAEASFSVLHNL